MAPRLNRIQKLTYGVGDIGFSLTSTILAAYFAIFLTDVIGIRPGVAAIAIFIGKSWDYINDPLFGHLTDRTRTRWGRRRPFLLFGFIPLIVTFTMLWWKPPFENLIALVAYYSLAFIIYEAAATLCYMPYFALTPELTSDYDERTSLTTYRMFFSILGSLLAFTIPLMIVGSFTPENVNKVIRMGLLFGVLSGLPLLIVFFNTKEREEFMERSQPKLLESLSAAWNNTVFRYSLGIFLATWISVNVLEAILLYYIKYVVQREASSDVIMATIFVTAIFALPIWEWVSRRYDKRWAYIYGIAFWAIVQIVLITVVPGTSLGYILFLCVLAGIGVSAAHVLPWSIIPDSIEWGEYKTGERSEGMLYSLVTLIHKIASSIAVPAILLILDFTGYAPNVIQQTPLATWGIRIIVGPIPALLLGIGIYIAYRYPLDRKEFAEIVKTLKLRRAEQEAEL